jgi:hypothetical protein
MRAFVVDLRDGYEAFVEAFNAGFVRLVGGEWSGRSWDAFNDYLSWPEDESFHLVFRGSSIERCLSEQELKVFREILKDNPHVHASFSPSRQ